MNRRRQRSPLLPYTTLFRSGLLARAVGTAARADATGGGPETDCRYRHHPGAHGKIVDYRTYGVRDMATGAPMTNDTIFRDYSMTKPITGVAMMILYEQGKWLPSDPISKYISEFVHLNQRRR